MNNSLRQHDLTTREKSHIDFLFQIIKMGATAIQHRISSGAFSSRMLSSSWLPGSSGKTRWKTSLRFNVKSDGDSQSKFLQCVRIIAYSTLLIILVNIHQQQPCSMGQMAEDVSVVEDQYTNLQASELNHDTDLLSRMHLRCMSMMTS